MLKKIIFGIGLIALTVFLAFSSGNGQEKKFLILGKSKIIVKRNALVGVQDDRVIRDVYCPDSRFRECDDPFRVPKGHDDLVPYMEGWLSQILQDYEGVKIIGLTPAYAKQIKGRYYASDGQGNFPFEINQLRLDYKTVLYSADKSIAILPDTHGFHLVAGQAFRINRYKKLSLVIACMDQPAKAQAALYLAKNNIACYAPCDRFAGELIGYKILFPEAAEIIGTAPIRQKDEMAIIGNQPVKISLEEKIIIQYTEAGYPDQYCDTPARYFETLNKKFQLNLNLTRVMANVGETAKLVQRAKELKARVIGVRIHSPKDVPAIEQWLKEDFQHRAILFHSAAYEPGYEMFFKFPKQTSFGDLNPIIE